MEKINVNEGFMAYMLVPNLFFDKFQLAFCFLKKGCKFVKKIKDDYYR
jgi:hypothetical protein